MSVQPPGPPGMPGLLLAELDGVQFIHVDGIFAVRGDQLHYYAQPEAWGDTPAYHEHSARERVAQLEAELARLRARHRPALPLLAPRQAPPAVAPPEPGPEPEPAAEPAQAREPRQRLAVALPPAPEQRACRHCGKAFPGSGSVQKLVSHERLCPKNPDRALAPGQRKKAEAAAPVITWACATCGSTAATPAISDPTRCKACVAAGDGGPKAPAPA